MAMLQSSWRVGLGLGAFLRLQSQDTSRDMNPFQGLKGQFYM